MFQEEALITVRLGARILPVAVRADCRACVVVFLLGGTKEGKLYYFILFRCQARLFFFDCEANAFC